MAIQTISDQTFQETIAANDGVVLVDFWAPWCGPCKMVAPILDELDATAGHPLTIAKLNVDDNPETTAKFGIMSIPTLKLFKNGKDVQTFVGVQPLQVLQQAVAQHS